MFQLAKEKALGKELRQVVVNTLKALIENDEKIVVMDADLGGASGFTKLQETHHFINVGISEANMIGVAAGLSLTGFKPYVHSFAPFITRRVFDQLYLSGAYSKNSMTLYGSDPGFTAGPNGGTHNSWEDVALMRTLPHATVCDAADAVQMEWIIKNFNLREGIQYVRGNRKAVYNIYEEGTRFEFGKGNVLREGDDVCIVASGQLVHDCLEVCALLEKKNCKATLIDMFTIKPLDEELLLKHCAGKKRVITVENHNVIGGLGSAVAEVLAENGVGIPLIRLGLKEAFGQVGSPEFLQEYFGLTAPQIASKIEESF